MAIIKKEDKVLLINHRGLNSQNCFWMPPGGGLEPTESLTACIKREVFEETNLVVLSSQFEYLNEYVNDSLHAVELFFSSKVINYDAKLGFDPEVTKENQFMQEIKWMSQREISEIDDDLIHPIIKKYCTC